MKLPAIILFAAFSLGSCSQEQKSELSAEALSAPLQSTDGSTITFGEIIEKHSGKPTVIEFWASWCGDCVKAMPKIHELQAKHPEADFVFVSLDKTAEKWKLGIEKHQLEGDHYLVTDPDGMKGSFGKSIDLDWIPRYMIIDKTGKVALYRAIETDFDQIETTINKLK